jgi:hypothetical protein
VLAVLLRSRLSICVDQMYVGLSTRFWWETPKESYHSEVITVYSEHHTKPINTHSVGKMQSNLMLKQVLNINYHCGSGSDSRQRQRIFPLASVQTSSEAHPASCPVDTGGKARPGRDADHSPAYSAEVMAVAEQQVDSCPFYGGIVPLLQCLPEHF